MNLHMFPLHIWNAFAGSHLRAEHLKIISPLPGAEFKTKRVIRFEWETNVGSGCILEILNNRGNVITRMETGGSGIRMFNAGSFSCGVYYWKLLDHENLLYVGKFFLK